MLMLDVQRSNHSARGEAHYEACEQPRGEAAVHAHAAAEWRLLCQIRRDLGVDHE